ncbi:MAG: TRAM domain-containing protein [archaeon]
MSSEDRPRSFVKPVEEGKEYEVDIKETSRRGEGIARIEGFVVFVPNTKPGDHVKIKVTRVASRFAQGEVVA